KRCECSDEGCDSKWLERDVRQSRLRHHLATNQSQGWQIRPDRMDERHVRIDDERRQRQIDQRSREIPRSLGKTNRWKLEMCGRHVEFQPRSFRARTLESSRSPSLVPDLKTVCPALKTKEI